MPLEFWPFEPNNLAWHVTHTNYHVRNGNVSLKDSVLACDNEAPIPMSSYNITGAQSIKTLSTFQDAESFMGQEEDNIIHTQAESLGMSSTQWKHYSSIPYVSGSTCPFPGQPLLAWLKYWDLFLDGLYIWRVKVVKPHANCVDRPKPSTDALSALHQICFVDLV